MDSNSFLGLGTLVVGREVVHYKKVTSTNDLAWLEVSKGSKQGTVVVADEQFRGKGRFGRDWFSPAHKGVWLSAIFHLSRFPDDMFLLMSIGAIATAEVLRTRFNLPALIRWPNDVIVNNKKIAGIIVESKCIDKCPEAAVLGLGLNVNIAEYEIPSELKGSTTSVLIEQKKPIDIELVPIVRNIIASLDNWHQKIVKQELEDIQSVWREFSAVLDKTVTINVNPVRKSCITEGGYNCISNGVKEGTLEGKIVDLDPLRGIALSDSKGNTRWWRGEDVEMLRVI